MDKKYNFLFVLAILTAGVIAYSNSFDCSIHFDDRNIFNSSITTDSATLGDWIRPFPSRPLGILTFAANYHIHKLDVLGYHLVNLTIHLINALLIWWLTWLTFSTPVMKDEFISRYKTVIAFLTGLLFVTHPLATQSVTYIAQRFTSLATLFYLLSLILFIKGRLREGNEKITLLLFGSSMVSAVCGMLTKEIVFTLPFAVILYDYCFMKSSPWKLEIKDKSLLFSLTMLVIFIFIFLRNFSLNVFNTVPPDQGYTYSISMKEYFLTQFSVIWTYIRLFFLPYHQNLDYDYAVSKSFLEIKTLFGFMGLLGILAAGILLFKKYRLISFGIFWFFLTMSVESSIIPISQNVIFEHRTYLPGFGFFIALTGTFFYFSREKYFRVAMIILLLIAAFNTALTYQRNKIWKNDYTLWSDCLTKSPDKARVHEERGVTCTELGYYQQAIEDFNKAIRLNRNYAKAYYDRGTVYGMLGQYQKTIDDCSEAIRLKSDYTDAYYNRGNAYVKLSQYQRAIEDYSDVVRLAPDYAEVYINRGNVYAKIAQDQRAIEDYNKAIDLKPDYIRAYSVRAIFYFNQGNKESGCHDAQKACEMGNCKTMAEAQVKGYCR
jgi:tetratricopeptide (TPR) repeat protein